MMDKAWIVDLDGTLTDCDWRDQVKKKAKKSGVYDLYDHLGHFDPPRQNVIDLVNRARFGNRKIMIVTSRSDARRDIAIALLSRLEVKFDGLFMRKEGDLTSTAKYKLAEVTNLAFNYEIEMVIDDHPEVCNIMNQYGYNVCKAGRDI